MAVKLPKDFYLQTDVVSVAQQLIGKVLCTNVNGNTCKVLINETEAYAGAQDKASHAYGNRYTARTKTMFAEGGVSYVYLCYGIHHLLNVVTNQEGTPHAVLLRGCIPLEGQDQILKRRNLQKMANCCNGPGKLSQAMGIDLSHNHVSLLGNTLWIEDHQQEVPTEAIEIGPRIGVDYAEEDASLPYRFLWSQAKN